MIKKTIRFQNSQKPATCVYVHRRNRIMAFEKRYTAYRGVGGSEFDLRIFSGNTHTTRRDEYGFYKYSTKNDIRYYACRTYYGNLVGPEKNTTRNYFYRPGNTTTVSYLSPRSRRRRRNQYKISADRNFEIPQSRNNFTREPRTISIRGHNYAWATRT